MLIRMSDKPFGLLELGTNSLKHWRVEFVPGEGQRITTRKIRWRIAHDHFTHGEFPERAVTEILDTLWSVASQSHNMPVSGMLCVATGVFGEISTNCSAS